MTSIKRPTRTRPVYFRGQLLDETDFRAEQEYHRNARMLHNLRFHSWGVAQGLTVARRTGAQVSVAPGLAIDSFGREVILDEAVELNLSDFGPNQTLYVTLTYEEATADHRTSDHGEGDSRATEYSVLSVSTTEGVGASVTLAVVAIDAGGEVGSISDSRTHYATSILAPEAVGFRELANGSVTESKLGGALSRGWVRLPFKPIPLEDQEPFRIGPTEARSRDDGAVGGMAIPTPPGVTTVTGFRIAGELNEGVIKVELYRCGWDPRERDHEKTSILTREFGGTGSHGPFEHTVELDGTLDPGFHALSLVVSVTKKTSISLVALEFGYPADT